MSRANLASQRLSYTGADQFVTVPAGATHVEIKAWGAGGGGAGDTPDFRFAGRGGGGGGFSSGTAAVAPGQRLLVVVGQGGQARSSARTYGQGGAGGRLTYPGGSGGGLSGVFKGSFAQANALVIAGGGGGGTGTRNPHVGPGGGGGLSGSMAGRNARDGGPGTQTAGGVAGTGGAAPGAAGAALWGGNAGWNVTGKFTMSGGGGGGGYWGGGGGVSQATSTDINQIPGVGGGGSGYLASAITAGTTTAGQAAPAKSTGGLAAGRSDPAYRPGLGNGGGSRTNGGHGQVVLQWQVDVGLLQVLAGDGQVAGPSEDFGQPLAVKALSADGRTPIPGAVVTFTVTEGDASFPGGSQSVSVTADSNGQARTPVLTAGVNQGPVKVTARSGSAQVVFSLEVTPAFEVFPGGPPDVQLVQGGGTRYPGVRVRPTNATGPIGRQNVEVRLPMDKGLQWGTVSAPDYQLTVLGGDVYQGQLSADQMVLTFDNVDLDEAPGPEKVMWVGVSAGHDAPLGTTSLTFTVGGKISPSTPTVVTPGITMSPGVTPLTAQKGGASVYPGVVLRNNGAHGIPLQTVTVALPADADMHFGTPGSPDHQLTVQDADESTTVYVGTLSGDGQALTFSDVDLAIPDDGSQSIMWVGVSAGDDTPSGPTTVEFSIGSRTSPSTTVEVI